MATWTVPTLRDVTFDQAKNNLPGNVWPIECKVKLDRTPIEDRDLKFGIARSGEGAGLRMFRVLLTNPNGYLYGTTFFANPVEKPQGKTYKSGKIKPQVTFEWDDFVARLDSAIDHLMTLEKRRKGHRMPDQRLYIRGLRIVEIPIQYIENGGVSKRFFGDHAEFWEATFGTSKIVRTREPSVKKTLGGGLPGNTILPMEMIGARQLLARLPRDAQYRYSYWVNTKVRTMAKSSSKCEECGRTWNAHRPKVYDGKQLSTWSTSTLRSNFAVSSAQLLGILEYTGTKSKADVFSPKSARWL